MAEFTEANRQHFDQKALSYKTEFSHLLRLLCNQVLTRRLWISDKWTDTPAGKGQEVKMLDYACGVGILSITLAPFLTKVIGLDLSDSMVNEFNKDAREAALSDRLIAYKGDLVAATADTELSDPKFFNFDLVLISMAFHHFADPGLALKRLRDRLKSGGTCVVIDFVPDNHRISEDVSHTVKTHGFTSDDMKRLFEDAGLSANFDYQVVDEPFSHTKNGVAVEKTIFIDRKSVV